MSFRSESYLAGVIFCPNAIAGYINEKVEQNKRDLHQKAEKYAKNYTEIIHGMKRNRKKAYNSSMLEYTGQMKTLQHKRLFVPSQSIVYQYNSISSLYGRQLPKVRNILRSGRHLDGGGIQITDRKILYSPKTDVSESFCDPSGSHLKEKPTKRKDFRLKFGSAVSDGRLSPVEVELIPKTKATYEPSEIGKVNALTGNYNGLTRVKNGRSYHSKGKAITIKLPPINTEMPAADTNGLVLTLEPELLTDKDYKSNVNTVDDNSEYELNVSSISVLVDDAELKAK